MTDLSTKLEIFDAIASRRNQRRNFLRFAGGSALLTGWGRANFDQSGVAAATQSRYTIFAAYLLYGIVYYCVARAARDEWREVLPAGWRIGVVTARACVAGGVVAISILAALSYAHGIRSYTAARNFNDSLAAAYSLRPDEQALDTIGERILLRLRRLVYAVAAPPFDHSVEDSVGETVRPAEGK